MFRILFRRKWLVALIVLLVIAGGTAWYFARQRPQGVPVTAEGIQRRGLIIPQGRPTPGLSVPRHRLR